MNDDKFKERQPDNAEPCDGIDWYGNFPVIRPDHIDTTPEPRRGIAGSLEDIMREEMRRGFIGIPPEHQIPPV